MAAGEKEIVCCRRQTRVPVFMSPADGYSLYRMLVERVVSTQTAAAGGNTTPMTLGA